MRLKVKFIALALFIVMSIMTHASVWHGEVVDKQNIKNSAVYQLIKFSNEQKTVFINEVLLKQNKYKARVVEQKPSFGFVTFRRIFNTTKDANAFLGINGGFFSPDNNPLGLVIIDNKKLSSFSRARLLSGLILINSTGSINLKTKNAGYKYARYALQTGPFIIRPNGRSYLFTNGVAERRTVLGLSDKNDLLVLSISSASLSEVKDFLSNYPNVFGVNKIRVALNLDGGSSTAMTLFIPKQRPLIIPELLPVRNAIVFNLK